MLNRTLGGSMKAALGSLAVLFLALLFTAYGPAAAGLPPAGVPAIATPVPQARGDAYLYAGPGLRYPRRGSVRSGASLRIVARNGARTWFQIADGRWIAATLVRNPPAVPVARNIPPLPTATRRPSSVRAITPELPRPPVPTPERPPEVVPGIVITLAPSPTATAPVIRPGRAAANANLRAGPGMGYRVVAWALKGEELQVVGTSPGGAWSQLANGLWIATYLLQFDETLVP
jgi:uncharacterized protein YraI